MRLSNVLRKARRFLAGPWFRRCRKRICVRCELPIKRNHKWSAKAWIDDPRPRHWDCANPTAADAAELVMQLPATLRLGKSVPTGDVDPDVIQVHRLLQAEIQGTDLL